MARDDAAPLVPDDGRSQLSKDIAGLRNIARAHPFLTGLLIFIPLGLASPQLGLDDAAKFSLNFMAILPMAWLIGKCTEDLAAHTNEIVGGLINATFGNIVEMLLCVVGIMAGQYHIVQCTLIGSMLSNLLLVMGTAFIYGGSKYKLQTFSQAGAGAHCSLLLVSCLALVLPTLYGTLLGGFSDDKVLNISRGTSIMLLAMYVQYLVFQLLTHSHLFQNEGDDEDEEEADLSFWAAGIVLAALTVLTAFSTDILVASIEGTISQWGIGAGFIGIIVLPVIGNAAEHYTAITVAGRNKMELSLGVAVGSSCQMALLVTPFCVLAGWALDRPMTLNFHPFQVAVLLLSVMIVNSILADGSSNWLEGSMLVTSYICIALIYFFAE